jgi:enterochelin esterase-like enzyme
MLPSTLLALAGLLTLEAAALVTIRKTGRGPTGYEVDFRYTNTTAKRVLIGGGIQPFTDQFHTTGTSYRSNGRYDPHDYRSGDFYVSNPSPQLPAEPAYKWPYEMTLSCRRDGIWTYTTPLPSGIYSFAYLVDCNYTPNCSIDTGHLVLDPDLPPPFMNVAGDQVASSFQVPFDDRFQASPELNTNFDYALDAPDPDLNRGTVTTVNYTSPGSIHPAADVHDFGIYLPAEYGQIPGKRYPLLYLSHGAGGNGADWENLGRMSHIMDNLIRQRHIPPTVVVTPSFYNLDSADGHFIYGNKSSTVPVPPAAGVRENFSKYLFPWVESHYSVCANASCRAFAGLSMGGVLAYEMFVNATDVFDYYGMFSPATTGPYIDATDVASNLALLRKGVMVAYGLYDFVFPQARELQTALDAVGIRHITRVTPFGSHYWNTWQDELWWFGRKVLWKPLPFSVQTGR